jgi:hypothetical protein
MQRLSKRSLDPSSKPLSDMELRAGAVATSTRVVSVHEAARILEACVHRKLKLPERQRKAPSQNAAAAKKARMVQEAAHRLFSTVACKSFDELKYRRNLKDAGIELAETELFHTINYRPTTAGELYDPIAEPFERFGEDGLQRILDVIQASYDAGVVCKCARCTSRAKDKLEQAAASSS